MGVGAARVGAAAAISSGERRGGFVAATAGVADMAGPAAEGVDSSPTAAPGGRPPVPMEPAPATVGPQPAAAAAPRTAAGAAASLPAARKSAAAAAQSPSSA